MSETSSECGDGSRAIAALLNPRPVVLVSCCDRDNRPNVLSVAWHTPLSHDPPLVGISLGATRLSHELIAATGQYVINVVGRAMRPAVELCGNYSGRERDKVALARLPLLPARCVRPPVIATALAHLECEVVQAVPVGDHTLFIGRVVFAAVRADCFGQGWDPLRADVLLCLERDRFGYCAGWGRPS